MKRKCLWLLCIAYIILHVTGCSGKSDGLNDEILAFIERQEEFVKEKDMNGYIDTITTDSPEYVAEKKSWMRDIVKHDISEYQLKAEKIQFVSDDQAHVVVSQTYQYNGEKYKTKYPLVLRKVNGMWKDSDMLFEEMETEHFLIKYFEPSEKYAVMIRDVCETAYEDITERYGDKIYDKTVIKVYNDKELLRQSVKLSFAWQFAGWYEYPESIKTTEYPNKRDYMEILEHELIHKITIQQSNNNMPYWFTEGVAVYFANFPNQPDLFSSREYYKEVYGEEAMDILKLEATNLEKLENDDEISNYYDSSGMVVKFLVDTYGMKGIKEIIGALGQYEYIEGTGAEVDPISQKRFHEVVKKVLGKDIQQLNKEWIEYLYHNVSKAAEETPLFFLSLFIYRGFLKYE
ncbi:MAG: hypothetical protein ACOYVK_06230 [Bacillota bacterium]